MLYCPKEHEPLATRFGQDIGVAALGYRAYALYCLGYPESALRDAEEALKSARELSQTGTLAVALMFASTVNFFCRKFVEAEARAEELIALSEKYGFAYLEGHRRNVLAVGSSLRPTEVTRRSS